jgi:hypothetical protein
MALLPLYTTVDSVRVRLTGKVQFQADPQVLQDGELPDVLLLQLIADAETAVEQDLRGRYKVPFQSIRTGKFEHLPDHSRRAIRRAVDLRCVMEILRTDFGRGSHVSGENYYKEVDTEYKEYLKSLMGHDAEAKERGRYRFTPPLDDLALSHTNRADDGFRGRIINTDASIHDAVSYAEGQINNPSKSNWRRSGGVGGY